MQKKQNTNTNDISKSQKKMIELIDLVGKLLYQN